jgi:hypothetical protein
LATAVSSAVWFAETSVAASPKDLTFEEEEEE